MLFNSLTFFCFFLIFYSLYLLLQGHFKFQNKVLLIASYIFYGWWDWRFLSLILLSTTVDYFCGLMVGKTSDAVKRKLFLTISVCLNLGILGFFKYFNFFAGNFEKVISLFGFQVHPLILQIILPVGVSFYTFQEISYIVDVYRKQIRPVRNFLDYALFVAFFPQLMAGPINRATHLLPQILNPRVLKIGTVKEGLYLILWGLFKKVFIADNLAIIANEIFAMNGVFSGGEVLMGVYAFAFQIYGDFSGYTDMARGLAKLMGIELMVNFRAPYLVTSPPDFWRNWHISLSTWLRDYLYIPLGGNRKGTFSTYRNLFLTMLLGGLWHGAAWVFIIWGAYHGFLLIVHRLIKTFFDMFSARPHLKSRILGTVWHVIKIVFMFHVTCVGWLIFRSQSLQQVINFINNIFVHFSLNASSAKHLRTLFYYVGIFVFLFLLNKLKPIFKHSPSWRFAIDGALSGFIVFFVLFHGVGGKAFIYFQF